MAFPVLDLATGVDQKRVVRATGGALARGRERERVDALREGLRGDVMRGQHLPRPLASGEDEVVGAEIGDVLRGQGRGLRDEQRDLREAGLRHELGAVARAERVPDRMQDDLRASDPTLEKVWSGVNRPRFGRNPVEERDAVAEPSQRQGESKAVASPARGAANLPRKHEVHEVGLRGGHGVSPEAGPADGKTVIV